MFEGLLAAVSKWADEAPGIRDVHMNLIELIYAILIIGGATRGGVAGQQFGALGVIAGIILGGVAGLVAAFALTMLVAKLFSFIVGEPFLKPKTRDTFGSDHKDSD